MKRVVVLSFVMVVLIASSLFAVGTRVIKSTEEITINTMMYYQAERIPTKVSWVDKLAKEKFGIVFEYDYVPYKGLVENINLRFAAGDYPDWVEMAGYIQKDVNRWGKEGHVIDLYQYIDKLPNYRGYWTDSEWEDCTNACKSADGNLYYLPAYNFAQYGQAWVYRKDLFDAVGVTEFPETLDELYNVLKKIDNAYPKLAPAISMRSNKNNPIGPVMEGFTLANRTRPYVHVDIDSNEVVYGPATDKYRNAFKFANKLYAAGMIDKEFPTITTEQWTERKYKQGISYIEYSYNGNHVNFNKGTKELHPNIEWATSWTISMAEKGMRQFFQMFPPWYQFGPFITKAVSQEKVDRLIQFLDWSSTDEGGIARSYGEPGVTMEFVDGKPKFLDVFKSDENPDGLEKWDYRITMLYLHYFMPAYYDAVGDMGPFYQGYYAQLAEKDFVYREGTFPWLFTPEEEKDEADIGVMISDTYQSYGIKFIIGDLDPNKDADWQSYLNALKEAKFDEWMKLYKTAYARMD